MKRSIFNRSKTQGGRQTLHRDSHAASASPPSGKRSLFKRSQVNRSTDRTNDVTSRSIWIPITLGCLISWVCSIVPIVQSRADSTKSIRLLSPDAPALPASFHVTDSLSAILGTDQVFRAISDSMDRSRLSLAQGNQLARAGWQSLRATAIQGVRRDRFNPSLVSDHLSHLLLAETNLGVDFRATNNQLSALPKPKRLLAKPTVIVQSIDQGPVTTLRLNAKDGSRYLSGLTEADFSFSSGGGQTYPHFVVTESIAGSARSSVCIVIDISGSMENGRLQTLVHGLQRFLTACHPETSFTLIPFDHEIQEIVPMTTDRDRISVALEKLRPRGATDITNALGKALTTMSGNPGNKTILLCTDGSDNKLVSNISSLVKQANANKISICTLGLNDPTLDRKSLEQLSEGTNGISVVAENIGLISAAINDFIAYQTTPTYQVVVLTKDLSPGVLKLKLLGDPTGTEFDLKVDTKTDARVGFRNQ